VFTVISVMPKFVFAKILPVAHKMWLAGLFDGEGCINKYRAKDYWFLNVAIVNSEYDLIEPFLVFGGYVFLRKNHEKNSKHLDTFCYTLRGNSRVLEFILTLMPYMRSKKKKNRMLELLVFRQKYLSDEVKGMYGILTFKEKLKALVPHA